MMNTEQSHATADSQTKLTNLDQSSSVGTTVIYNNNHSHYHNSVQKLMLISSSHR